MDGYSTVCTGSLGLIAEIVAIAAAAKSPGVLATCRSPTEAKQKVADTNEREVSWTQTI